MSRPADRDRRAGAIWTLGVDAVTAEVSAALTEDEVDHLLLKGPAIARWLYSEESDRAYSDTDLLVDPLQIERAHGTLDRLGFRRLWGPLDHAAMERPPSYAWRRGSALVDLHETLPGAGGDRRDAWIRLRAGAIQIRVAGQTVLALGLTARLAHVVLHADHHGPRHSQPLRDLARALQILDRTDWPAAHRVAAEIGAGDSFASGLGLLPEGREVAEHLGLDRPAGRPRVEDSGLPLVAGIDRLVTTRGIRGRLTLLRDELFPSVAFMRWWTPLARRSRRGLVAAYAWRLGYLASRVAPAFVAWARIRGNR